MSQWPHSNWLRAVGPPSQVVFSSPNTRNPSSGGVIVNPASSSSSPGPSGPSAQPLASSSGPGSPSHDVSSSNQTSTFGVASRLGQSAAPPATIVPLSGSSLTHSASAPITRATMTINDPELQRIHEELEAIQKSLGEQLDQLKPIRNDAKLLEELAANINTYDNHVARNLATLNRPGASSTQSSASPSSSREPNHEAPSSKSSSLVGIVASFGQSVDPPAATMSPPGSSLSRSSLAPITGAMKSPKEQKLQSLRMELEALRKTMREELDRLKIIQHEMRLPEQLRANINAYEDQVARLEKEKKEAKQRFQSSSSQYGDPRMLRLLRTEHEQNQKRIEYQIHQWDKLSKEATTNLESLKQYHPSMKAEANALRVSLTGHETMRAFLVEMITDIEGEYLPQETSDEMIRRVELGLSERTSREPRSPEVKSTLARGFPTIDHSSEA